MKERRDKAELVKEKRGSDDANPVHIEGRKIAKTFWGKAWCTNLESYSDYSNRLPRGRSYVRNGAVIDLRITEGLVKAVVVGTRVYEVRITIDALADDRWQAIKEACSGGVASLAALLSGELPTSVMEVVTQRAEGLFPSPQEIQLRCSCPDWATMCKHVAAALYGTGARLDNAPELLFTLRGVEAQELIDADALEAGEGAGPVLADDDLASVFGIDLDLAGEVGVEHPTEDDQMGGLQASDDGFEHADDNPEQEEDRIQEDDPFAGIGEVLSTIVRPGTFCGSGVMADAAPLLEVDEFGPLPMPVVPLVAARLRSHAEPAPYGRGPDTVVDPEVRRAWQVDASRITSVDPRWTATLDSIVEQAAEALGVDDPIAARLYKLLLYEPGDFFVPHRDTEKEPGMFGTLVVVLPSRFEGGAVTVEHGDDKQTLQVGGNTLTDVSWLAFYADCRHEIRPLTEGVRVALVFNLVRQGSRALHPPDHSAAIARLGEELDAWTTHGWPTKLCVLLDHRYSRAELSWAALKGQDRARAMALVAATAGRDVAVHLAMVGIEEAWSAEETWYGTRRYRRPDPDDVQLYDLIDQRRLVSGWRDPSDRPTDAKALPFEDIELWPPEALLDAEPDWAEYHEATGNEGATLERAYHRAAVVLWPSSHGIRLLAQAGAPVVAEALRAEAEAEEPDRRRAEDLAHAFAGCVRPHGRFDDATHHEHFLEAVSQLALTSALRRYLAEHAGVHGIPGEAIPALTRALALLEPLEADDAVAGIILAHGHDRFHRSAQLLDIVTAGVDEESDQWSISTWTAVEVLESDPEPRWVRIRLDGQIMAAVLRAVLRGTGEQADALLELTRDRPDRFPVDSVVLPAVLDWYRSGGDCDAAEAWRKHCTSFLSKRTAEPPTAPTDWSRTPPTGCRCDACTELAEFLCDPDREVLDHAARKERRQHLEGVISSQRLDVRCQTIRRGNPHTLRCTKTNRRYEARMSQYESDLAALEELA